MLLSLFFHVKKVKKTLKEIKCKELEEKCKQNITNLPYLCDVNKKSMLWKIYKTIHCVGQTEKSKNK